MPNSEIKTYEPIPSLFRGIHRYTPVVHSSKGFEP